MVHCVWWSRWWKVVIEFVVNKKKRRIISSVGWKLLFFEVSSIICEDNSEGDRHNQWTCLKHSILFNIFAVNNHRDRGSTADTAHGRGFLLKSKVDGQELCTLKMASSSFTVCVDLVQYFQEQQSWNLSCSTFSYIFLKTTDISSEKYTSSSNLLRHSIYGSIRTRIQSFALLRKTYASRMSFAHLHDPSGAAASTSAPPEFAPSPAPTIQSEAARLTSLKDNITSRLDVYFDVLRTVSFASIFCPIPLVSRRNLIEGICTLDWWR